MDRRAFIAGTLGLLAAPLAAEAQQEGMRWWRPTWSAVKGLGPGVSAVVIDGNPNTGPYTLHVRYPPGHTVGPHRHKSTEHVTVLFGDPPCRLGHSVGSHEAQSAPGRRRRRGAGGRAPFLRHARGNGDGGLV